ncbi:Ig-like domain-containing protein, partial [Pantoea endophytica]
NEGEHNLSVTFRDPVGNVTAPTPNPAWKIIVDVTAPDEPVLGGIEDSAGLPVTGGQTNETKPVFKGTANPDDAGSVIELRDENGDLLGTGVVDDRGNWEAVIDPALEEGDYAISIGIKDPAGNTTLIPTPVNLEVDLSAPELPGDGGVGDPGDVLEGAWDNVEPQTGWIDAGSATNDNRPEFRGGNLDAGDVVYVYDNASTPATLLGTAIVGTDGRWSFEPTNPMGEGEHRIAVIVRDPAGNASPASGEFVFDIDTIPPSPPVVGIIEDSDGNPIEGGVTNDPKPVIIGTGNPNDEGSIVEVRDEDGNVVGTGVVGEDGSWVVPITEDLDEGEHKLVVVIVDPADNETPMEGDPIDLIVDITAPDAPEVIGIEDATGATIGDVTNDPHPIVVGTADPSEEGSLIEIRDQDGNVVGTGVVDEDGNWKAPISPALEEG